MAIVTGLAIIAALIVIVAINLRSAPTTTVPAALNAPASPVASSIPRQGTTLGASGAPVKVDAWEDYQCPFCGIWTEQWEPHVVQDFVTTGIVRYQFHDYAFLGSGRNPDESLQAAVAAQCANDQGRFWEYHDWLYANQNPNGENLGWFTRARLDAIALKVGLEQAPFDTCLADPARATAIQAEQAAGSALGVNGTPSIFVNSKPLALSTYAALATVIRSLVPAQPSGSGAPLSPGASAAPSASGGP
jgi:protein-disulfide isomerase